MTDDEFLAAFEADEPFPQVLNAALTRVYEQAGWDLVLGEPKAPGTSPAYPTLGDLQAFADQVVLDIGYGPEVERNVRGFITVRLGSLRLGTPGRFFEGGHPLDFGKLLGWGLVFNNAPIEPSTLTDSLGRYAFPGLAPGSYALYAWQDLDEPVWVDPDFLKSQEANGTAVKVEEGSHQQIELKVSPTGEEWR